GEPSTGHSTPDAASPGLRICFLCGNSILLYVSYKKKNFLKPAEYFIINLAISDLGMTLTLYPLAVTSSLSHRWLYGKHICLFYAFCGILSTLTLLSTVCCPQICFPAYGNRFRREQGQILVACAWTYAEIFACFPLAHWGEYGTEPYGTAYCIDWHSTNVNVVLMSYTIVLFVFCFVLPCGVIITSYSLILITVKESRKAVEQHVSSPTRMSNVQTITVKVFESYIAVCIGFFAAWSPYAIIAMWAAFGSIDKIPPLAFAVPAVFAKSSTLHNPVIYLLLRSNFRNTIVKDFTVFQQLCIRTCSCIGLRTFKSKNEASCNSLQTVEACSYFPCEKCSDTFECFKNYPKCCQERLSTVECTPQESVQGSKKSVKLVVQGEKSIEIDNLEITLETVPVHCTFTDL
uniref:G-protein coupled receptors family 1 profile domain-containing protein n=1 Tax=Apteryx owenii TaxID=8824 RepID=A0A8B9PS62_APTOW